MKRVLSIIAFVCCAISYCFAQEENNIYVYRNDGDFNAFMMYEVDSITYSEYDMDSVKHDHVQIQVIWTQDSVYRIPVEVIDSISFISRRRSITQT